MSRSPLLIGLACLLVPLAHAAVSESDYLSDVPNVISVSRLSQPLEDTPGAMTVLDRRFIRMTGARTVVDVLRYVPGFQVSNSFETDAPMATYHGRDDDWANRIQVLVDGRSVYSGLLQGSAGVGWQTLALGDIERIEVLRGSNSASYGARAFLGVVNIISRDVRETVGNAASLAAGENGVADMGASLGGSVQSTTFRISADSVDDNGLEGAYGKNHTERLNLAAHVALDQGMDMDLRAGGVGIYAGRGSTMANQVGNPARNWFVGSRFVQWDWHKPLNDQQDLRLSASHTENTMRDRFAYLLPGAYYGANIEFSGNESVDALTLQHTLRLTPELRTVWGAELRRENLDAPTLFDQMGSTRTDFQRLFGSAEWHMTDSLLLNAGALAEHNTISGDSLSPRLMLNWRVAPGHTLRAGTSTAFRPPSVYENYARIRYYDANGQNPTRYYTLNNGALVPEKLLSRELGYYFAPPASAWRGDVRIFDEQIRDGIAHTNDTNDPPSQPDTYVNSQGDTISGIEFQVQWQPSPATRVFFSQNWTAIQANSSVPGETRFRMEHGAPQSATSLVLMHSLPSGLHLSLMHQQSEQLALMSISTNEWLSSMHRTDVRVAQDLWLGGRKSELALTVQNLDQPFQDGDRKFTLLRRAWLGWKLDY